MNNVTTTFNALQDHFIKDALPVLMDLEETLQSEFGDDRASAYYVYFTVLSQVLKDLGWSEQQLMQAIKSQTDSNVLVER